MPYDVNPEPGEKVLLNLDFLVAQNTEPFCFAVSDRALYLPAKKLVVVSGDPCYFRRIPKEQVREVRVQKPRPYAAWVLAALLLPAGAASMFWMLLPFFAGWDGAFRVSGWPLATIVLAVLLPFAARGRQRLVVSLERGAFKWNPPTVIDRASKERIQGALASILDACREAGIPVSEPPRR